MTMTWKFIMAFILAFFISSAVGAMLVPWLRRMKAGQEIREVGPTWHKNKAGTPTMGGLMFIAAVIVASFAVGFKSILSGDLSFIFVLLFGLIFGAIGFFDDLEKLRHKKNLGLTGKLKFLMQLVAAVFFVFLLRRFGYLSPNLYIPFWNVVIPVSEPLYFIFAAWVIVGTVNAANLTDGVDGLAAGTSIPIFLCFTAVAASWGREFLGLGIFSSAMTGALLGFLLYNYYPAKVFMGDTGSLFLGGCVSGMAFAMDMPLILVTLCVMFIIEALSDIIQVSYFKLTKGKRVFRMAPFHHHLEMGGWSGKKWTEKQIVALYVIVTFVFAALSLISVAGRYSR